VPRLNRLADPVRVFVPPGFLATPPARRFGTFHARPRTAAPHLWAPPPHIATPRAHHRATGSRRNQDRSVVELVVDTEIDHLDIAIVAGELIARRQAGESRRRNSKGLAVQPDKIILEPRRPIVPESPLDASTQRPAEIAVAG
jgi:hypothetical protein